MPREAKHDNCKARAPKPVLPLLLGRSRFSCTIDKTEDVYIPVGRSLGVPKGHKERGLAMHGLLSAQPPKNYVYIPAPVSYYSSFAPYISH